MKSFRISIIMQSLINYNSQLTFRQYFTSVTLEGKKERDQVQRLNVAVRLV